MKRAILPILVLMLAAAMGRAQGPSDVYTRPAVPPREVLDRLNLQLGWRVYVPTEGKRDGLFSIQLDDKQVFVQTRSGLVTALDLETGVTQWRARVGNPYPSQVQLGF